MIAMSRVIGIVFVAPWRPLENQTEREGLPRQLKMEISPDHPLWGLNAEVIGRADTNDDILVSCSDDRLAIVHLVWGKGPGNAKYPATVFYETAAELNEALWRDAVLQGFIEDFDPNDSRLWTDQT